MELLEGKANYERWRIRILSLMGAHNPCLVKFITYPPSTNDPDWHRLNSSGIAFIFSYVSNDVLLTIAKLRTANEIWTFLAREFGTEPSNTDQKKPMINESGPSQEDWFIDASATQHITFRKEWFDRAFPGEEEIGEVGLLNGSRAPVKGQGNVAVVLEGKKIVLSDVLYVPCFKVNVISVSCLTSKGYSVSFDQGKCKISNGEQVFEAPRFGDFYKFSASVL